MKLSEMNIDDFNISYFIHYYDNETKMWCPVTYKGFGYMNRKTMEECIKTLSCEYKVFEAKTTRII